PSSDRKNPPCLGVVSRPNPPGRGGWTVAPGSGTRQSITAYIREGCDAAIATPERPIPSAGNPRVICIHVSPPSVDLYRPPPGPFVGAYVNQGGRRVFQRQAKTFLGFDGSIATSTPPTDGPLSSTFFQVFPPSVD